MSLVIFAFFFYLALIVTTNILLDALPNNSNAIIASRALFTLQTIPAALIVISRAGHKTLIEDMEKEKGKEKAEREAESFRKLTEAERKVSDNLPQTYPHDWRKFRKMITLEQVKGIAIDQAKNIAYNFGVDERTARNWRKYADEEINPSPID